jgi:hypothetical protein
MTIPSITTVFEQSLSSNVKPALALIISYHQAQRKIYVLLYHIFLSAIWWLMIKAETCRTLDYKHCPICVRLTVILIFLQFHPHSANCASENTPHSNSTLWQEFAEHMIYNYTIYYLSTAMRMSLTRHYYPESSTTYIWHHPLTAVTYVWG